MNKAKTLILFLSLLLMQWQVDGQQILIDSTFTKFLVGKNLEYITSKKDAIGIQNILNDNLTFKENNTDLLLFHEDEYESDIWLKFHLINTSKGFQSVIIDANNGLIDQLEFYDYKGSKQLQKVETGDEFPAINRAVKYRSFVFQIQLLPNDTHTIYMKANLDGRKIHLPIIIQNEKVFIEQLARKESTLGIYYGIMILITVLFFYLYHLIKDRAFLTFAVYMAMHTLSQFAVSGFSNIYLWPNSTFWADRSSMIFMALSITCGIEFVIEFITKEKFNKWILIIARALQITALITALGSLGNTETYNLAVWINYKIIPPFYIFMFLVASSFFITKYLPARIFLVGYLGALLSISGLLYIAYMRKHDNVFTNNYVIVGETFKCIMLGIALLDRLKYFKEEKEKVQAQLITQLEEINHFKEATNTLLEKKVEEKSKELNEKQLEVRKALIWGEELERKRVAQELHDGMGSLLSTLRMNAESIDLSDKDLSAKELLAYSNVIELIDRACTELRNISHDMLPIGLDEFGIEKTLNSLLRKINSTGELQISLDVFGFENEVAKETELALYRIVLELINNIIKHAKATQAFIQLVRRDDLISLLVEDNGVGMEPEKAKRGLGMLSIQTRVEALKGKIQIESVKDKGTTFNIELPL